MARTLQAVGLGLPMVLAGALPGLAQNAIIPDGTLGAEPSVVTDFGANSFITGGAVRGGNLFHSFDTFNVGNGNGAFFVGGAATTNIFSRVTGASPSEIFGTLGTAGTTANLYFINPNGIVFGPNAELQVGGSFTATTASGIEFGGVGTYSAVNPQAPSPLLTVDPSAYFFGPGNPGSIRTGAPLLPFLDGADLQVPDGESLTLLGGEVVLESSSVIADGGRIEIGAVGAAGVVGLGADGGLGFPEGLEYRDIDINQAFIASTNSVGGVSVTGGNITISNDSLIGVGLSGGSVNNPEQVGDLEILASGDVVIGGFSLIANQIFDDGIGTGGNIQIVATNLEVIEGAQISAATFGVGDAGDVTILVNDVVRFQGGDPNNGGFSGAFSSIESGGVGNGGNIQITATNLEVLDGALLGAESFGLGNAGNVILTVSETASFQGSSPINGSASGAFSTLETGGEGHSGTVQITATNLEVLNGAQLSASSLGVGDAGHVILTISDTARFQGVNLLSGVPGGAFSSIGSIGEGGGGTIQITATNLEVLDGAQLVASTFGMGDAGDVILTIGDTARFQGTSQLTGNSSGAFSDVQSGGEGLGGTVQIIATNLEVLDGAQLVASTAGVGDAGNIVLTISDTALFQGSNPTEGNPSGAFSSVEAGGIGEGGNIQITATNLEVRDGAQLITASAGLGNAGDVILIVRDTARIQGGNPVTGLPSSIFSSIEASGVGDGGDIRLTATNLEVLDGGLLIASSSGIGDAGNVILTISNTARFQGRDPLDGSASGAFSSIEAGGVGNGGDIQLTATTLEVRDGGLLVAASSGIGDAGNVILTIADTARFQGSDPINGTPSGALSSIEAGGVGNGGDIQITATTLDVLDGAQLIAASSGTGDAGSVMLTITGTARFQGRDLANGLASGAFSSLEPGGDGNSGNVQIVATTLEVLDGAALSAASSGTGGAGAIILILQDQFIANDGTIETSALFNAGGQIAITADNIQLFGDSDIQTFVASGDGGGGDITLTADLILAFDDSDILAFAADGNGGNITLATPAFFGENFTLDSLTADPATLDGNDRVDINATGAVSGAISLPDTSLVENSIADLTEAILPTDQLVAGSCIAQRDSSGSFVVTGAGGIPPAPSDVPGAVFATGAIRATPIQAQVPTEPTGVFRLADGRLVLSQHCRP